MPQRINVKVAGQELSALTAGATDCPAIVLLHGWPLCSAIWRPVIEELAEDHFVLAFDLPGTGQSAGSSMPSLKTEIADIVLSGAEAAGARDIIVAGVDVGGMIAFSAARDHGGRVSGAIIMNTVIPGLDPWDELLANPQVWHFAFHQLPDLPETLVSGRERAYFDFFLDFLAGDKTRIDEAMRQACVDQYSTPSALKTGFDWYRAMPEDAKRNAEAASIDTPVLYLRGDADGRSIAPYVDGLKKGGASHVDGKVIAGSGEILSIEVPGPLADAIGRFAGELALQDA
jgi:pimeloyl-ACP methyl ester carboxylesterase